MNNIRLRRRGYSLIELLMALTILMLTMNMGIELFRSVMQTGQQNQKLSNDSSRTDGAIAQLRRDVWGSTTITVSDPHSVQMNGIAWTITPDAIERSAASQVTQWPVGSTWTFSTDARGLTVTDTSSPDAPPYRLVSQLLLSRSAQ